MADELEILVKNLSGLVGPVYVELPHNAPVHELPFLDVVPVGPARRQRGSNVFGADTVDVDVDVYTSVADADKGKAWELANKVRRRLHGMYDQGVRTLDVGRPERRPDRNQNIRRVGVTVTLGIPVSH